jgi:hypothetical protein
MSTNPAHVPYQSESLDGLVNACATANFKQLTSIARFALGSIPDEASLTDPGFATAELAASCAILRIIANYTPRHDGFDTVPTGVRTARNIRSYITERREQLLSVTKHQPIFDNPVDL